jgi:hypothetical protein
VIGADVLDKVSVRRHADKGNLLIYEYAFRGGASGREFGCRRGRVGRWERRRRLDEYTGVIAKESL